MTVLVVQACWRSFYVRCLSRSALTRSIRCWWTLSMFRSRVTPTATHVWCLVSSTVSQQSTRSAPTSRLFASKVKRCRSSWETHLRATYPTAQVNAPRLTPARKAGTRSTYPGGMEGWVELGYIPRLFTHPQTVTHPSINRAWRRVTTLIETKVKVCWKSRGDHLRHVSAVISEIVQDSDTVTMVN